jgi:hypothetical protein
VFERQIWRRIFGPTQNADEEWRKKTNKKMKNAIRYEKYSKKHQKQKAELVEKKKKKCQMKECPRPYTNGNRTQQDRKEGQD